MNPTAALTTIYVMTGDREDNSTLRRARTGEWENLIERINDIAWRGLEDERLTLLELREMKGWTRHELALKSNVAERTIYGIERQRSIPTMPIRRRLLEVFGVPLEQHVEVFGPLKGTRHRG